MTTPTRITGDEIPCCPKCKKAQDDAIKDYFAPLKERAVDMCGWCDAELLLTLHKDGMYEVSIL